MESSSKCVTSTYIGSITLLFLSTYLAECLGQISICFLIYANAFPANIFKAQFQGCDICHGNDCMQCVISFAGGTWASLETSSHSFDCLVSRLHHPPWQWVQAMHFTRGTWASFETFSWKMWYPQIWIVLFALFHFIGLLPCTQHVASNKMQSRERSPTAWAWNESILYPIFSRNSVCQPWLGAYLCG
jgi:hypothetical protein